MFIQRKRIVADEELDTTPVATADVDPEATYLLFEAEDVAELVAEVTGEPVEVTVEDDSVKFAVGDDEFLVEPEGDEEILEAVRLPRKKRAVAASTRRPARRPAPAKKPVKSSRTIRKAPASK